MPESDTIPPEQQTLVVPPSGHEKHCFVVMPFGRDASEQKWFRGWYEVVIRPAVIEAEGVALAWSVRSRADGRRIATAGVSPRTGWIPDVLGYANRTVAHELAARVRARLKEAGYRLVIRDEDAEMKLVTSLLAPQG